jgi:pre-mRNA cleavage complex 2 protein Pcf11
MKMKHSSIADGCIFSRLAANKFIGALLEQLRSRGLLNGATPVPTGFPPPPPFTSTPPTSRTPLAEIPNDVELTIRSLKMPRPHLIYSLYEKLGIPCVQCGRRFKTDEEGKKKKTAHMDWHFNVNRRMADDNGQHRSWYLDVREWIKFREIDDAQPGMKEDSNSGSGTSSGGPEKPKIPYVPVPSDIDVQLANKTCPICQDQFKQEYLNDEWVWMDAMIVGEKYYHASCYAELQKNISSTMRSTPEPVLGKRKAEVSGVERTKIPRRY